MDTFNRLDTHGKRTTWPSRHCNGGAALSSVWPWWTPDARPAAAPRSSRLLARWRCCSATAQGTPPAFRLDGRMAQGTVFSMDRLSSWIGARRSPLASHIPVARSCTCSRTASCSTRLSSSNYGANWWLATVLRCSTAQDAYNNLEHLHHGDARPPRGALFRPPSVHTNRAWAARQQQLLTTFAHRRIRPIPPIRACTAAAADPTSPLSPPTPPPFSAASIADADAETATSSCSSGSPWAAATRRG